MAATLALPVLDDRRLVTTVTPTGQERRPSARRVKQPVDYLPFELGWPIRRFLTASLTAGLVLCEGDYWPLLLRHVQAPAIPVAVVNGRVGDRSYRAHATPASDGSAPARRDRRLRRADREDRERLIARRAAGDESGDRQPQVRGPRAAPADELERDS